MANHNQSSNDSSSSGSNFIICNTQFSHSSAYSESAISDPKITIFLKYNKKISLMVKKFATVKNIKEMLCDKEGIHENFQELYFGGIHLKDENMLDFYGIKNHSTLDLLVTNSGAIRVCISIGSKHKTIEVIAKLNEAIFNVKCKIEASEGIEPDDFTLFHAGIPLDEDLALASYGISRDSTLYLVINPKDIVRLTAKIGKSKTVNVDVKVMYTVNDVKAIVGSIADCSLDEYEVIWDGEVLEESKTLVSYGIKGDTMVEMELINVQIFVKHWSGKTISLFVCPYETVGVLMDMICLKLNEEINVHFLYVTFAGKVLSKDLELVSCGVERDCTLYLTLRLVKDAVMLK